MNCANALLVFIFILNFTWHDLQLFCLCVYNDSLMCESALYAGMVKINRHLRLSTQNIGNCLNSSFHEFDLFKFHQFWNIFDNYKHPLGFTSGIAEMRMKIRHRSNTYKDLKETIQSSLPVEVLLLQLILSTVFFLNWVIQLVNSYCTTQTVLADQFLIELS